MTRAKPCETAQTDIRPAQAAAREVWHAPQLYRMGTAMAEASPGNNAEGDFTS